MQLHVYNVKVKGIDFKCLFNTISSDQIKGSYSALLQSLDFVLGVY